MVLFKKGAVAAAAVLICLLLLSCLGLSAVSYAGVQRSSYCIVLDAGHGGVDPGVLGTVSGVKESDVNLKIVQKLQGLFADAGFRVVLTRKNQGGLYGLPTQGYKRRDMEKRREIIQEAQPNLVISVHQNNFLADRTRYGGQVFFREGDENSVAFAECIQPRLNGLSGRDVAALKGDFFMLECTDAPSVLVECGFLSNAREELLLLSDEYQNKIADAIFKGTLSYLC